MDHEQQRPHRTWGLSGDEVVEELDAVGRSRWRTFLYFVLPAGLGTFLASSVQCDGSPDDVATDTVVTESER